MSIRHYILGIGFLVGRVAFGCSSTRTMIEDIDCGAYRHLTVSERLLIARTIESYAQCKMLISNTGLDSGLWMEINKSGQTIFLEHDQFWIDLCTKRFPGINIIKVEYELFHERLSV